MESCEGRRERETELSAPVSWVESIAVSQAPERPRMVLNWEI